MNNNLLWKWLESLFRFYGQTTYSINWYSGGVLRRVVYENGVYVLYEKESLNDPFSKADIVSSDNAMSLLSYRIMKKLYERMNDER